MEKDTKDLLDGVFKARKDKAAGDASKEEAEEKLHQASVKRFTEMRDAVIVPAMQEIAAYLGEQGFGAAIGSKEDGYHATDRREIPASVTLLLSMSSVSPRFAPYAQYQGGPFFEASFDKRTDTVSFLHCLRVTEIRDARPQAAGDLPLAELSQENVRAKIAETIKNIYGSD